MKKFIIKLTIKQLIYIGIQLGHLKKNSKFLAAWLFFGWRSNIFIINLIKTFFISKIALKIIENIIKIKRPFWFLTMNKIYGSLISRYAIICGESFNIYKWISGSLTNIQLVMNFHNMLLNLLRHDKFLFRHMDKKKLIGLIGFLNDFNKRGSMKKKKNLKMKYNFGKKYQFLWDHEKILRKFLFKYIKTLKYNYLKRGFLRYTFKNYIASKFILSRSLKNILKKKKKKNILLKNIKLLNYNIILNKNYIDNLKNFFLKKDFLKNYKKNILWNKEFRNYFKRKNYIIKTFGFKLRWKQKKELKQRLWKGENRNRILKDVWFDSYNKYMYKKKKIFRANRFKLPGGGFTPSLLDNITIVTEFAAGGTPLITLIDSNIDSTEVIVPIPSNDDSIQCINFFSYLIAKTIMISKFKYLLNWKKIIKKNEKYNIIKKKYIFLNYLNYKLEKKIKNKFDFFLDNVIKINQEEKFFDLKNEIIKKMFIKNEFKFVISKNLDFLKLNWQYFKI